MDVNLWNKSDEVVQGIIDDIDTVKSWVDEGLQVDLVVDNNCGIIVAEGSRQVEICGTDALIALAHLLGCTEVFNA